MLTQRQALAAAGYLLLAFEPELPTISSEAHGIGKEIGHEGEHIVHGHIVQMHVKTPAGEVFYHLPIGSLIVKHPGKVHGGYSRIVRAGEHEAAIPKHATVHVAKDTDLSDEAAVKNAAKHITIHSPHGEHRHATLHPNGDLIEAHSAPEHKQLHENLHTHLSQNFKELPHGKKPVMFGKNPGAWVPEDWQMHSAAGLPGAKPAEQLSKWAKDSEGNWHIIHPNGKMESGEVITNAAKSHLLHGKIKAEPEQAKLPLGHVEPEPHKPGVPSGSKLEVSPGVHATPEEIHKAISILQQDKSTAVKQPLAHAGHHLAAMDYHAINKATLKAHPELKVEKGTKQAHVGQVKTSVLHHLASLLEGNATHVQHEEPKAAPVKAVEKPSVAQALAKSVHEAAKPVTVAGGVPQTEAEKHVTQDVKEHVVQAAAHAQELTPATHMIGGVPASKEHIQAAIDKLSSTKATAIKQALIASGNPLKDTDYWAVVKAHQQLFPSLANEKAKPVFIAALKHHLAQLGKEDEETGHNAAAEVHQAVEQAAPVAEHLPEGKVWNEAVKDALKDAHDNQHVVFLTQAGFGKWKSSAMAPEHGPFYRVTPSHAIYHHQDQDSKGVPWNAEHSQQLIKDVFGEEPKLGVPDEHGNTLLDSPEPSPSSVVEAAQAAKPSFAEVHDKFVKSQSWYPLDQKVAGAQYDYNGPSHDGNSVVAAAMVKAHEDGKDWYVTQDTTGGTWQLSHFPGSAGLYGAKGEPYYKVTPWHEIIYHNEYGQPHVWEPGEAHAFADTFLKDKEEAPLLAPKPVIQQHEVSAAGEVTGHVPAGSIQYTGANLGGDDPQAADFKYVKLPDGSWQMHMAAAAAAGGTKVQEADQEQAASLDKLAEMGVIKKVPWPESVGAPPDEPDLPEPIKMPVLVKGKQVGEAPLGSQIYHHDAYGANEAPIKYVKQPDGSWHLYGQPGKLDNSTGDSTHDGYVATGKLVPDNGGPAGHEDATAKAIDDQPAAAPMVAAVAESAFTPAFKEPQAEPEMPPALAEGMKPVMLQGEKVAEVPHDAKIYYQKKEDYGAAPQTPESSKNKYVLMPNGDWMRVYKSGLAATSSSMKNYHNQYVTQGKYIEEGTETPEHLAELTKAIKVWQDGAHGSVGAKSGEATFEQAIAHALVDAQRKGNGDVRTSHFWEDPDKPGKFSWYSSTYNSGWANGDAYTKGGVYRVSWGGGPPKLERLYKNPGEGHYVDPHVEALDSQKLYDAAGQHIVPHSIMVDGKQYQKGFYYSPKGKAFLELDTDQAGKHWKGYNNSGEKAAATYIWHKTDGTTEQISPSAGMTKLEANTEFSPVMKEGFEGTTGTKKIGYATLAGSGKYQVWSEHAKQWGATGGPHPTEGMEVKPDGSAVFHTDAGPVATAEDHLSGLLKGGALLDQHGTTVVKPGVEPDGYHIFGSKAKTTGEMQSFLQDMQTYHNMQGSIQSKMKSFFGLTGNDDPKAKALQAFTEEKLYGAGNWQQQRDAIVGLVRELLQVPKGKESDFSGAPEVVEAKYLKGLPAGVHSAKQVFNWTKAGQAHTMVHVTEYIPGSNQIKSMFQLSSPELAEKIKAISAVHGEGKVVGTHVASLNKNQRIGWLQAWRKGDMQTVFKLDAGGGKVSPVHPGAPKNVATHQIQWAPWSPSEVHSSSVVPGEWSDHHTVTLPKAEVGNYVIAAGLQNPEHLSMPELRNWVTAHRDGNQDIVDHLSSMAQQRFATNQPKLTDTPQWADHLEPAKSYDIFLEEKKPAQNWQVQAAKDFVNDHWTELEPHADTSNYQQSHYANDWYAAHPLIQKYLDAEQAKWEHEMSKPVWSDTPGAAKPASSHPIFPVTQTIPLTGATSKWYFKPTPPQQAGYSMEYRPQVSHAATTLARAWGFKTPESQLITHNGQYGAAQRIIPNLGDLVGGKQLKVTEAPKIDFGSYTPKQLSAVAREHILDWGLDNRDGRAANMLHTPDGDIIGIDKEHAWRNLGQWKTPEDSDGFSKTVATQLYAAISQHQVSKFNADKTYISAIQQARRMQQLPDERMRKILQDGFQYRNNFGDFGSGAAGRAKYIQAIVDRKNGLEGEFQHLWGNVYKNAGWSLPEVPKEALSHGLHSGFSEPTFFDHVMASRAHGVPAFFTDHDLEQNHFLVWTEHAGDNVYVRGEGRIGGSTLDHVAQWAAGHQEGGLHNAPTVTATPSPSEKVFEPKVQGEYDWHHTVVDAAKAVSKHQADQVYTGAYTKQTLDKMDTLKGNLESANGLADEALQAGADSPKFKMVLEQLGHPEHVQAAAKHYLDQIAKVEDAKEHAGAFHTGDLPRWTGEQIKQKAAVANKNDPAPEVSGVKVELRPSTRILNKAQPHSGQDASTNALLGDDGHLHLGEGVYTYPGNSWHITLPGGEIIEINDKDLTSTTAGAHVGRIRFRAVASNGSSSLEAIRSQLQAMGVPMEEAQQHGMELAYWRHVAGQMSDRADWDAGKSKAVFAALKEGMAHHDLPWSAGRPQKNIDALAASGISPETEAEIWRSAFGHLTSPEEVNAWLAKDGHLPHLSHLTVSDQTVPGGKPFWYRPDVTTHEVASQPLVTHSIHDASKDAERIANTGGLLSTEARLRVLGLWKSGSSSTGDMNDHGSSGAVYTRVHSEGDSYKHVWLNPRVLARTTGYSFPTDAWGDVTKRANQSHWNFGTAAGSGITEFDLHDAVSLLDDTEFLRAASEPQRLAIIKSLKNNGIHTIRGMPVEDRIVTSAPSVSQRAQAKQLITQHAEHMFDHPAEIYVPPASEAVSAEHSATETAEEMSHAGETPAAVEPADVAGSLSFSADHGPASPESDMNQVFFKQPSYPGDSAAFAAAGKTKGASAARVSQNMTSSDDEIEEFRKAAGFSLNPNFGANDRDRAVAAMIQTHSQGNSSPFILAYQDAVGKLFGTGKAPLPHLTAGGKANQDAADALTAEHGKVIEDFARASWLGAQEDLAKQGVNHLTVYRKFSFHGNEPEWAKAKAGSVIDAPAQRPFSQWAYRYDGAAQAGTFTAGGHEVLVKATIPREMVVAYPHSGVGCYKECEVVLADAPGHWEIVKS